MAKADTVTAAEIERLRAIEDAARWHLANSACAGWQQGEVLALALGLDPDAPRVAFNKLLRLMGHDVADDPLDGALA